MKDAVELARQSDVAIIVGGLTHEWESEGFEYVPLLSLRPTLLGFNVSNDNSCIPAFCSGTLSVDHHWTFLEDRWSSFRPSRQQIQRLWSFFKLYVCSPYTQWHCPEFLVFCSFYPLITEPSGDLGFSRGLFLERRRCRDRTCLVLR